MSTGPGMLEKDADAVKLPLERNHEYVNTCAEESVQFKRVNEPAFTHIIHGEIEAWLNGRLQFAGYYFSKMMKNAKVRKPSPAERRRREHGLKCP